MDIAKSIVEQNLNAIIQIVINLGSQIGAAMLIVEEIYARFLVTI